MSAPCCSFCKVPLQDIFVDLGKSPLCESFIPADERNQMEPFFPLKVWVCRECFLVQLQEYVAPSDIFSHYAYFSSYSESWLAHAKRYVEMAIERFGLGEKSSVVELASNDGYLLQYFVERGVPALGIDPAENVAEKAKEKGVRTLVRFFGEQTAAEVRATEGPADLILGNNVLAHVPDINDFVKGIATLLADDGNVTMEFPHLLRLMEGNQFDTIYHEHFSYLSLDVVRRIFAHHGMTVYDVEELPTHGGSLRIFAGQTASGRTQTPAMDKVLADEAKAGLGGLEAYTAFSEQVIRTKHNLLKYLIRMREEGKRVAAYGAPGKGNTLLNYCGIRTDLIEYAVDRNPFKHGRFTPGTEIPIYPVEHVDETQPDRLLILPWNLREEIAKQMGYIGKWGGKLVVPIPEVEEIDAD
ncbi:MAG: methyltransferase domain-containing protein [Candidatus Hydrogenedens sp.]|nr:methyltransferase domain-containing protein [Candidatus Hydrogenedens sp.]